MDYCNQTWQVGRTTCTEFINHLTNISDFNPLPRGL